jgi:hypothetical protein
MPEPGTKVTGRHPTTRVLDGVQVTQTVISWNDTDDISVDYCAGDIDMYADPHDLTSFDAPLSDEELRDLLATYGVRGFKLTASDPNTVVVDMLDAAAGALGEHDTEGIALVAAMLDAVLDEDAKAARPAIDIVRAEIAAI